MRCLRVCSCVKICLLAVCHSDISVTSSCAVGQIVISPGLGVASKLLSDYTVLELDPEPYEALAEVITKCVLTL
jgi:hypothetical protein